MKQQKLFHEKRPDTRFGGSLLKGRRKTKRPLTEGKPLHLVLRSEHTNKKIFFSPRDRQMVSLVKHAADRYRVKVYKFSVNWNHFHFVILPPSRKAYVNFVRYLPAQVVHHLSRTHGVSLKGLFSLRPFTRIVSWGQDFMRVCKYVMVNIGESFNYDEDVFEIPDGYWRAGPCKNR